MQTNWKQYAFYSGLCAIFVALLGFRLGTLLPGFSAHEIAVLQSDGIRHLLHEPVMAPYYLLVRGLTVLQPDYLAWGRVASALCGMLTLVLFCGITWYWHGRRNALLGTVLFGTSAWFLHTARWGTPDVLLFFTLALTACYVWLHATGKGLAVLTAFIVGSAALYIPGMIWLIIIGIVLRWKSIDTAFKHNLWAVTAGGIILLAAIAPLGFAIYAHPETAKILAGLPADGWPQPFTVLHTLALTPYHLLAHASVGAERWLGDTPIIDAFTGVMCILGGYVYVRHFALKRVHVSAVVLAVGAVLASLGGMVTLSMLMPFVYIVAAAGIGFMIDRWLEVFPRNGLAQWAGYTLMSLAIASACIYSLSHYFIGWPQARATRTVYSKHSLH